MMNTASLPRVPEGLRDLMKVYTKEVLREKPPDLYDFSAKFFNLLVAEKSHQAVRKYEPVQTYETIMKNRIRQQVPLSMVFNIIPETLTDLIKKFIKAVLREKPENIYIFAQEYFQKLSKEKSGRIEYTKYSSYEKSLKDKENVAPVSKVTCECGRVLSAQTKDLGKAVSTETTKLETIDQISLSNSISYVKSVVTIQRHFRRYLKQKKIGREKNKCNSVEYMTAILIIQRQFRRVLAKKRVEKLRKSRPPQLSYVKFNAANYMKAVVVIQRHYRIYLKRKQERNRLKTDTVSLATAAIIIQKAFRRMVAVRKARRTASVTADPGEELNDNASETGSYTSVSTALLSTESTELGLANYEEKVHQKIIHEDEEVENNNVDASLEKEYFAEPIKGDDKSIEPRKSEKLSGALIENMIPKNSLEKENGIKEKENKDSAELEISVSEAEKPLDPVIEDKFEAIKASKQMGSANGTFIKTTRDSKDLQEENEELIRSEVEKPLAAEIEDEFTAHKAGNELDSALEIELKNIRSSIDLQQEIKAESTAKKASEDLELEGKDVLEAINVMEDQETEIEVKVKTDDVKDPVKPSEEILLESSMPNKIDNIESDVIKELVSKELEDTNRNLEETKGKGIAILSEEALAKEISSEIKELTEKPIETEVTPKVSIEIELVDDDDPEQAILIQPDADVNSRKDLADVDCLEEQPRSLPTVEIDSLKTVLTNHNREVREKESAEKILPDEDSEKPGDATTEMQTEEDAISAASNFTNKQDNQAPVMNREKRSLDNSENILDSPQPQRMEIQETFNEGDKEASPSTEEKRSIEETETQSNLEDQDSLNKQENKTSSLTREKRSIEDTEIGAQKSSLDVKESIIPDDANSNINIIETDEKTVDQSIVKAEYETTSEMDDKLKEEVTTKEEITPKEDLSGLVDAETGEITVHKTKEEFTEPLKKEIITDLAPQTDHNDDSKEKVDQRSEIEVQSIDPIVPERKTSTETSGLTETEKEGEIIHHLEEAVGFLIKPKTDEEQNNIEASPEEDTNLVKNVPEDPSDASEESESLEENRKLSHQETMPIGSDPSQVKDIAPTDGSTEIESNSIEEKNIESDNSTPKANTDDTTPDGKKNSTESAMISATTVFGEDLSHASIEHETERLKREISVDSISNKNAINTPEQNVEAGTQDEVEEVEPTGKPTAVKGQQSTETNVEDSASTLKKSNDGSGILQVEEEAQETLPVDAETILEEDSKSVDESTGLEKGSSMPDDAGTSTAPDTMDSKEISIDQSPDSIDNNSRDSKEKYSPTSLKSSPSLESFKQNEKRAEESTAADAVLAMKTVSEASRTTSQNETDQEHIPTESVITEESIIPLGIPDNPESEETKDSKAIDDKSLIEPSLSEDKAKDILESLEDTKLESNLEKRESIEGPTAPQLEDKISDRETKPNETPKVEDGKENIETSSLEDITPTSNEKAITSVPSHPEKNSSLLVSNQLIGTQNLPTNRIEIEKNTKKLSSASVRDKDKDIGTLTSGRLMPTPIAELQLKSFKAPNDDGAWYDIYVEPQQPSDKDLDNPPPAAPVPTNQIEVNHQVTPELEPTVVAERVPSYYTPKEIVETNVPKAKNSISFFVSFDSDDGKPKYKIPKKFREQSKGDTSLDKKSKAETEYTDEDIEVIEVSEGDPEYQQMGGSKLQTIMELNENEHPEVTELPKDIKYKEEVELESVIRPRSLSKNNSKSQLLNSTKSNTDHFESVYKTDILNIIRSVQIIERAYRRFKNRRLLDSQKSSDFIKQNNAAKIIQKWVRNFLMKKSPTVTSDISQRTQESLAARKIQRAYRIYVEKNKESISEKEILSKEKAEKEKRAALVIQKAFRTYSHKKMVESKKQSSERQNQAARKIQRAYKRYLKQSNKPNVIQDPVREKPIEVYTSTEVNASPSPKIKQKGKPEEVNSRPISNPTKDFSGLAELHHHQAAEKIQRAYKRYLKKANKPKVIQDPVLEEPIKVYKSMEVNANPNSNLTTVLSSDKLKEEEKVQEDNSRPNSSTDKDRSDLTELNQHQAAEKIQRAYKRYLYNKTVILDSESEKPIRVYKSTEVNVSQTSTLSTDTPKEEDKPQEVNSRPISKTARDVSGLTELKQHQAAEKIQRAYRRYLNRSKKPGNIDLESKDLRKIETPAVSSSQGPKSLMKESEVMASAALIIQRAFRQYMERRKLENLDEISLDSITSSRITAIENSMCPTEGTPSDSLIHEEIPSEDATQISPKSEWFVGSTRIVPSQGVVEDRLELETEPEPAEITRITELDTSTQVESVETVDRSHGSLESKLTSGSSKIDENQGNTSKQDNAVSSGLAGLTEAEAPEAGAGSTEDRVLLSQSDAGGIFQTLDIASTQELVNDFINNEIQFSSAQGPYKNGNKLEEVIEEPCIKRSASLVSLSEGETGNDSSKSEATGLDTLSADTIDKATVKLSKPEEVIEKMSQLRDSKSSDRILSAEPSFEEPVIRPMSSLQAQASLDIEDGDIIVYNRLQRDETRESSAQSDSVVFGEAESEKIVEIEMVTEEESGRVHLMRHYTIAGDDPRGLFRSVTIDEALSYGEMGEKELDASLGINSTNSFYLDDETSENIRKKMMAYSLSETDSDYFDPKKISNEDFDIDTAMADAMGTSTETESTIVSAATKIQAGARGFLTRRRLRRASAGTKSSTMDTKASFGNDAISESLERFIEEEAAKKIQAAYRIHTRKRRGKTRRMEGISLESNLAARRQKLQRGDALRNDSTPDDENSSSTNGGHKDQKHSKSQRTKAGGDTKSRAAMELKWLAMRQNSMPVQIDCEVFRVIPKHMRKRIKSAESSKRK